MNAYKATFEPVDISLSDEEETLERASTPIPRCEIPNYSVVLEVPHSPAESTVGEEENFDSMVKSFESDCKKMRLNLSYESIESQELPNSELALENLRDEGPADSPESPDGSLSSEIFIDEDAAHEESTTRSRVLE